MKISHRLVLRFPPQLVDKPVISELVKKYNLTFSILRASISPKVEGLMVLELIGEEKDFERGERFLTGLGVKVQPLSQDIKRNEERCTHCGVCVGFCPTLALNIDRRTMKVNFEESKCIACEICLKACPPRAMEVHF